MSHPPLAHHVADGPDSPAHRPERQGQVAHHGAGGPDSPAHRPERQGRVARSARARVALTGLLASLGLLAAACGGGAAASGVANIGGTTSTTGTATATAGASPQRLSARLQKWAACMRSHGLPTFPSPAVLGQAVKLVLPPSLAASPQFLKAQKACQSLAPPRLTAPDFTTQQQADYLKAAACMRSHGIAGFPDPAFAGGGVRFNLPPGMDANSTPFRAARVICEKLIPQGLPYSS